MDQTTIFIVRLYGGLDLDIDATTPESACAEVARLHPALGSAILELCTINPR